jgi:hypothetical protein
MLATASTDPDEDVERSRESARQAKATLALVIREGEAGKRRRVPPVKPIGPAGPMKCAGQPKRNLIRKQRLHAK